MTEYLSHKIELKPSLAQVQYFAQASGVARFSYNWALTEWKRQYKAGEKPSVYGLIKQQNAVKGQEWPWMRDVTKAAPQYAIHHLGKAYQNWWRDLKRPKGKRLGVKPPKPKKKGHHESFQVADNGKSAVKPSGKAVKIPRLGWVKMCEELRFEGKLLYVVVSRTADKWFASFTVETEVLSIARESQAAVGVDLGIKTLATLSDGTKFENPKPLRNQLGKLRRLCRSLSRKVKGSKNRAKAKVKLARLHYRIACIRKDCLHRITTFLVRNYSLIGAETLNIKGMLKNRKLSRAISDLGLYEFRRQLEYKGKLYGSDVVFASQWFPSSKTCHMCGCVNEHLTLADREWVCAECGTIHDRDINAAINLKLYAMKSMVSACGADVRPEGNLGQSATKQELNYRKVG
jgi:putative transposase